MNTGIGWLLPIVVGILSFSTTYILVGVFFIELRGRKRRREFEREQAELDRLAAERFMRICKSLSGEVSVLDLPSQLPLYKCRKMTTQELSNYLIGQDILKYGGKE